MSASEPEGLAVGTRYAPALHGNLAEFGGGHQWKAKDGNVRENQRGLADHVLWVGGGGAEGQLQVSVHVSEVRTRITRVTPAVPVYKTSFKGLSVRGIKVEDQDSMEYKTVKVAKEVESFCCYEVQSSAHVCTCARC